MSAPPFSSADVAPRAVADETAWVPWVAGFGALALLGAAVVASREGANVRVGILNGITGHWAGTWVAFTPDTFGELVSRLKYPEQSVEERRSTHEWTDTAQLYDAMMRVREAAPVRRPFMLFGESYLPYYRLVFDAIKVGRPRDVLTGGERQLLKDFMEALDAWLRVSKAARDQESEVRVTDVSKVFFMRESDVVVSLESALNRDIEYAERSLQRLRVKLPSDLVRMDEEKLARLYAVREELRSRGVFPLRYLKLVRA